MKKYGQPGSVVTDGLCSYPAAMKEIGNADRHESAIGSITARKTHINPSDDENELCSSFGVRRHYKSSVQFTLRSTTILIRNVISSPAKSTNRDARLR
jgi:hypothetical protein